MKFAGGLASRRSRLRRSTTAVRAQAPLKIGFMAELSGPQGALGQDQYDAFMMVVEQNGGKLGGVPVQVIREDSQLKPEVATQLVDKLIEKDKVPIITGITFSNVMMAVHKKITDKEVFLIGSNAGPAPIAGAQCSPYAFITSWQNDNQAEVVGKYATDKGYKRVDRHGAQLPGGQGLHRRLQALSTRARSSTRSTRRSTSPTSPPSSRRSPPKNPDAVYVFYPGGLGVNFVRQYKQAGLMGKVPLLSTSTTDGSTLPAQKDDALGVISGTFWGPDFNNPVNRKFVDDFEKKYNRIPSQYAAQSYDAALLLDSAIGKVKGNVADKKAFMAALKAADFKSVRGNFKFNNNGFPIQDHVRVRGRQGRQGPREPEDDRHAAQGPPGRVPHAVHVEVSADAQPLRPRGARGEAVESPEARHRDPRPLPHAGAERPAARHPAVPARRRADARVRDHEFRESRARVAVHDGRVLRGRRVQLRPDRSCWRASSRVPATMLLGVVVERVALIRLYRRDHLDQVLATFGLILFFNELVRIIWGPASVYMNTPAALSGTVDLFGLQLSVLPLRDHRASASRSASACTCSSIARASAC